MRKFFVYLFVSFLVITCLCLSISLYKKNVIRITKTNFDTKQLEQNIKDNFPYLSIFKNAKNISLHLIDKNIYGNNEFFLDSEGNYRIIAKNKKEDLQKFISSFNNLSSYLETRKIPLYFVELPDAQGGKEYLFRIVGNKKIELTKFTNVINAPSHEWQSEHKNKFFFRTDFHFSTEGEIEIAKSISEILPIPKKSIDYYFSPENYRKVKLPFIGNTARVADSILLKADDFNIYVPLFKTDITEIVPSLGIKHRGSFETTLIHDLNLADKNSLKKASPYHYWVTNFGRYPQPTYEIINHNQPKGPSVLIICDSIFMRGLSYLALVTHNIFVYDPRFNSDSKTLKTIIDDHKFDAIFVLGYSDHFYNLDFF